jgi:pantetheine-phosphate adenylyltransferase
MKSCIIPGSFDPFTLGHFDIVKRASKIFDKVYVVIMVNSEKNGKFDFRQRKLIAAASCAELENVEVITADGLLSDVCSALKVSAIVKGIRNATDADYEISLSNINRFIGGEELETVFLPARHEHSFVSSTFVRELIKYNRSLLGAMHPDAIKLINIGFQENK